MKTTRYGRSHPRIGFTPQEDCLLLDLVSQFGVESWATIASYMDKRNARQCKDRYTSYLSPTINKGPFSAEEDDLLRQKYNEIGPKWVKISKYFPNRTDISVKCRWAVLNRRDIKCNEKKPLKVENNTNSTFSESLSSSLIEFKNTKVKRKNVVCSTMTLRKRKPHVYKESGDDDDDKNDFDFEEFFQSQKKDISDNKESVNLNQTSQKLIEKVESKPIEESKADQNFKSDIKNHSENIVNDQSYNNKSQSENVINPSSVFDFFSFYINDKEDIFMENFDSVFSSQNINMELRRNGNFGYYNQNNYEF